MKTDRNSKGQFTGGNTGRPKGTGNKLTALQKVKIEKILMALDKTLIEDLAKLKPVFLKDGTVTAGNSSGINDGAAALIMMSFDKARELGVTPLARVVATGSAAVDAKIMGMGVVPSVRRALHFANLPIEAIDYWEINEAFAAQLIGCNRELKIPMDKLNAHGGGIALGHPVGMTGARLLVSLIHEMRRRGVRYGGASLCGGGGPSTSMIVEAVYE